MSISAIVITKNEAGLIRTCMDSLTWVDEIIVVDSGSSDSTVEICQEYTDKVIVTDWPGFGPQKNRALEMATKEWVISLDADERVMPELCQEMLAAMVDPGNHAAFAMPRRSSYCGKSMRHSGWWPDYVTRLFRRGQARFSDDIVHERLIVDGSVGRLRQPLLHEAFRDLHEVLDTMNRYSTAGAQVMQERKEKSGLSTALVHGLWSFLSTYLLRVGFLDGREGFMLAISNAEGTYYKYLKLLHMSEKK
jgi:glycosyltransferase involved in cell wall biosynthesis